MTLDRAAAEALFIENIKTVDRLLVSLCRRYGMRGDDADDFASWAKTRLIEDDYSVVRQFRGESSLTAYLAVVLSMALREYRVQHWGRWRPSAAARRAGGVTAQLERLMHRDGVPFPQAAETLRTSGATTLSDRELSSLASALPARHPLRPIYVGAAALGEVQGDARAESLVDEATTSDERRKALSALDAAIAALPSEDQVIVRLRFWEDLGVVEIARTLRLEQKPLYRRLNTVLTRLRGHLETYGISRVLVAELITTPNEDG
jgi:RNA polymerase sigma factor for flagellar operon FliA